MEKKRRYTIAQGAAIVLSLIMAFTIFPMTASAETGNDDAGNPAADKDAARNYVQGQIIVVTEHSTNKRQMTSIAKAADGQVDTISALGDGSNIALVEVKEGGEMDAITALESEDKVLFAQPNYIYELEETDAAFEEPAADEPDTGETELRSNPDYPNDPYYRNGQKYLAPPLEDGSNAGTIDAKGAWDQLADLGELDESKKPCVAVIDTGARLDHEDLQGLIDQNKCVTYNDGMQRDFRFGDNSDDEIYDSTNSGHGTRVTGVIGATANNGKGVAGVAGNHVDMFVIDASTPGPGFQAVDIAQGIFYATDEGADLINISAGFYGRDYICERAVKYAWEKGTLCICSAGNARSEYLHTPGDSPYAITVMAHEWENGNPVVANDTYGTNYGVDKDVSAPGRNLMTTSHKANNKYSEFHMTSSATPVTAGSAALLLAANPDLTPREIKNLLYTSSGAENFSTGEDGQGFGRINVNKAMENLLADETDPEKIVINKPAIEMYAGTDTSIEYAVYPGNTNTTDVTLTSSNENVVKVDADGIVTAVTPGQATISLTCKNASVECNVTVKEIPIQAIDRKPYRTKGFFNKSDLIDIFPKENEDGTTTFELTYPCHLYSVNLEKNETIRATMYVGRDCALLRLKDEDGNIIASDMEDPNDHDPDHALIDFTAEQAGTYQFEAVQYQYSGFINSPYWFTLTSDRGFCKPKVKLIGDGKMTICWPAVEGADFYRVRKYADKDLTELEFEETVSETEYTDTDFDKSKVNYYTVTSCLKMKWGDLHFNGETPLVVKMQNPMTAKAKKKTVKVKAKKLKKKSVKIKRTKYLKITNAKGKLTYTKVKGKKKITVSKKTGKLKIKKGLKKGKYTVKVKVRDAGNEEYGTITRTVTFKVRVR